MIVLNAALRLGRSVTYQHSIESDSITPERSPNLISQRHTRESKQVPTQASTCKHAVKCRATSPQCVAACSTRLTDSRLPSLTATCSPRLREEFIGYHPSIRFVVYRSIISSHRLHETPWFWNIFCPTSLRLLAWPAPRTFTYYQNRGRTASVAYYRSGGKLQQKCTTTTYETPAIRPRCDLIRGMLRDRHDRPTDLYELMSQSLIGYNNSSKWTAQVGI
ncbi:hypothetical protein F4679DRAFT_14736 [Xylaria curta]|nr:hypothetical protein F4679DRAFT_14736 [Xylaria curta]